MDRRTFIQQAGVAALAGFALRCAGETAPQHAADAGHAGHMQRPHLAGAVGLQLYTLRSIMREDFTGPLRQAAQIGYKEFEFAGYGSMSPEETRAFLDEIGVRAPSTHVSVQQLNEDINGIISRSKIIGHDYIICPYPGDLPRATAADWQAMARMFNEWGKVCKDNGVQFGYHNHEFEFAAIDGVLPMDIIIENTDPELVVIELDLCWAVHGGVDPAAYFEKYPGRFHLCHVKDLAPNGEPATVGTGRVDFASIFAKAQTAGLKHYIVEHDNPTDPIASIGASYNYLTGA